MAYVECTNYWVTWNGQPKNANDGSIGSCVSVRKKFRLPVKPTETYFRHFCCVFALMKSFAWVNIAGIYAYRDSISVRNTVVHLLTFVLHMLIYSAWTHVRYR